MYRYLFSSLTGPTGILPVPYGRPSLIASLTLKIKLYIKANVLIITHGAESSRRFHA